MFGNFQVNIMCNSFIVKQFFVLFEIKIWDSTYEEFSNDLFSSSPVNKNMSRFYNKDIEILVALLLNLKCLNWSIYIILETTEAVIENCSIRKVLLTFLQNSQETHISAGVSFFKKNWLRVKKKGSTTGVFSWVLRNLSEH